MRIRTRHTVRIVGRFHIFSVQHFPPREIFPCLLSDQSSFWRGSSFCTVSLADVSYALCPWGSEPRAGTGIVEPELTNGSEGGTMTCGRCGGFMIVEVSSAYREASARSESERTRCLNCGNVQDAVISLNRADRSSAQGSFARLREGLRL